MEEHGDSLRCLFCFSGSTAGGVACGGAGGEGGGGGGQQQGTQPGTYTITVTGTFGDAGSSSLCYNPRRELVL